MHVLYIGNITHVHCTTEHVHDKSREYICVHTVQLLSVSVGRIGYRHSQLLTIQVYCMVL